MSSRATHVSTRIAKMMHGLRLVCDSFHIHVQFACATFFIVLAVCTVCEPYCGHDTKYVPCHGLETTVASVVLDRTSVQCVMYTVSTSATYHLCSDVRTDGRVAVCSPAFFFNLYMDCSVQKQIHTDCGTTQWQKAKIKTMRFELLSFHRHHVLPLRRRKADDHLLMPL